MRQPAASVLPSASRRWTRAVARYLDALRLLHYAPDTLHVRGLYLQYFATWATAQAQARSHASLQDAIDDLALYQATQKRNVLRMIQQIHQAAACVQEFRRGLAD